MSTYIWIILGTGCLMFATNKWISEDLEMLLGAAAVGSIVYLVTWLKNRKRVTK